MLILIEHRQTTRTGGEAGTPYSGTDGEGEQLEGTDTDIASGTSTFIHQSAFSDGLLTQALQMLTLRRSVEPAT